MSMSETPEIPGDRPPLALIAGPTASGKSHLAVRLAKAVEARGGTATIINCDSAQVYAGLSVLSARPSAEEMGGIEHRLFGSWDGATACSAADWAAKAKRAIADVQLSGGVPILVGGTGLYIRTLLDGIAPIPQIDPAIRAAVRALPQSAARKALESEDPRSASRLAPADTSRTCRALEVVRSTGRTMAQWHGEMAGGISGDVSLYPLILRPDRSKLQARCDERFVAMLDNGAAGEVAALMKRGLDPALPVMRAIGVREIAAWQDGELTREAMIAAGQLSTRQYAKRQYTWFRNQPPADWPTDESHNCALELYFDALLHN
ncbi:tRNA (adenosine(37)-N6)-dimethylallyltransferase MiaA [Altererythrobacter aquiaggeris]|uniref:tRNA (adenosine(37)-N6)-dimethylallyltransferase MiaA n=1 Tax=Aestuarierythrobacter aquiaggeris TaxID=1898396 RepID=UPI0030189D23